MPAEPHDVEAELRAYAASSLPTVLSPGADQARRTAYRRMRRRSAAFAALGVLALTTAVVVALRGPAGTAPVAAISPSPSQPDGSVVSPSAGPPSASPSPAPSVTPTLTHSSARPSKPPTHRSTPPPAGTPPLSPNPHDLLIQGPTTLTLAPQNGHYAGEVHLVAWNVGQQPYLFTGVAYTLPVGAEIDFNATNPPFGGCTTECGGDVIPAGGGHLNYDLVITAAYAPQAQTRTIGQLVLTIKEYDQNSKLLPDATPANNTIKVNLVLAGS
jgi:hypothetical protein